MSRWNLVSVEVLAGLSPPVRAGYEDFLLLGHCLQEERLH